MAYEVGYHPLVRTDLLDITILIGEYAGYDMALGKIEQIEAKLNSLSDFPYIEQRETRFFPACEPFLRQRKQWSVLLSTRARKPSASSASAMPVQIGLG